MTHTLDILDVKQLHKIRTNGHFFDKSTLRFFNSRILSHVKQDKEHIYFITSERYNDEPRYYTVREIDLETGEIETISKFQQFRYSSQAKQFIKNYMLEYGDYQLQELRSGGWHTLDTEQYYRSLKKAIERANSFRWKSENVIRVCDNLSTWYTMEDLAQKTS